MWRKGAGDIEKHIEIPMRTQITFDGRLEVDEPER